MARSSDGSSGNYLLQSSFNPLSSSDGPFTLAFWFKPANLTQTDTYILHIESNNCAIIWEYAPDTVEFFASGTSGATNPRTDSGIVLSDTNWHHIAYRKADGTGAWDKFLDGVKTPINASADFTLSSGGGDMYVFAGSATTNMCACSLAELALWTSFVSDGDLTTLAGGVRADTIGTPAYYWRILGDASPEPEEMGTGETLAITGTLNQSAHPFSDAASGQPTTKRFANINFTPNKAGVWVPARF